MEYNLKRSIDLLNENDTDVRENACHVLLAFCRQILSSPDEMKYREVRLDHPSVIGSLLPAAGAMECLFDVGYVEKEDHLLFPHDAPLSNIRTLHKLLSSMKDLSEPKPQVQKKSEGRNLRGKSTEEKKFLAEIVNRHKSVMRYEDPQLQLKARRLVPIKQLEINAMRRMRRLQRDFKINYLNKNNNALDQSPEEEITMKELFMLELLHWFKHDFFKWMNSPTCSKCSGECAFESVQPSDIPQCSRVEIHRCKTCNTKMEFPRYTDPEPLLYLRHGRCGEWANVFTLLCRALNYDARFVVDMTDHVWTEIWSETGQRWIHVDPCENVMDQPLMYEKGWKKKLCYVIAYSKDEVQDVTWRYTHDYTAIMSRRKLCSEKSLLLAILKLNAQRLEQLKYSEAQRQYILKRRIKELITMLYVPSTYDPENDKVYNERTTGSYAWRLARGEVSEARATNGYIWDVSKYGEYFELQYYIVKDLFKVIDKDGNTREEKSSWAEGINTMDGDIFRKVEDDWKITYLARAPTAQSGKVTWTFAVNSAEVNVYSLSLQANTQTFHNGKITWEVVGYFNEGEERTVTIPVPAPCDFSTNKVEGAIKICVTATLFGGNGDTAWQHAQLFRQSLKDTENHSMSIKIHLNNTK